MAIDFYHGHGSPYGWRVWLALEAKGIAHEVKILSFAAGDTRKPDFVAINPRHTVPTIVEDGHAVWESSAILEYLDEKYPQAPKLFPGDARERARIRRLVREAEQYVGNEAIDVIVDENFGKGGAEPDHAKVEAAMKRLAAEMAYFGKELRGPYFGGDAVNALDFVLYPWLGGFPKRITKRKPELEVVKLVTPAIAAWAGRIEALPYFDKTYPAHWR